MSKCPGWRRALVRADRALLQADRALVWADRALMRTDRALVRADRALVRADRALVEADRRIGRLPVCRRGRGYGEGGDMGCGCGGPASPPRGRFKAVTSLDNGLQSCFILGKNSPVHAMCFRELLGKHKEHLLWIPTRVQQSLPAEHDGVENAPLLREVQVKRELGRSTQLRFEIDPR